MRVCTSCLLTGHATLTLTPLPRIAGKTLAAAGLHQMPGALLTSIDRDGAPLPAVTKDEVLREGDVLWFAGGWAGGGRVADGVGAQQESA